jgi:UDP-glucose 4-epimerase
VILLKKVLITGANSYVGTNVEKWFMKEPENFYVETLEMRDPNWKNFDFSKFDVVFHVAGIVHIKETKSNKDLYYKVNRDLAIAVSEKAKREGVKLLIFTSTMSVYGLDEGIINNSTIENPITSYAKSKFEAEKWLLDTSDENFKVCVIRPPMIYGPNSPGNFRKLSRFAKIIPIYPKIDNKRSSIFIYNVCKYIEYIVKNSLEGIVILKNKDDMSTIGMIESIRKSNKKKTWFFRMPIFMLKLLLKNRAMRKIFTTLRYETFLQIDNLYSFEESIYITENNIDVFNDEDKLYE